MKQNNYEKKKKIIKQKDIYIQRVILCIFYSILMSNTKTEHGIYFYIMYIILLYEHLIRLVINKICRNGHENERHDDGTYSEPFDAYSNLCWHFWGMPHRIIWLVGQNNRLYSIHTCITFTHTRARTLVYKYTYSNIYFISTCISILRVYMISYSV